MRGGTVLVAAIALAATAVVATEAAGFGLGSQPSCYEPDVPRCLGQSLDSEWAFNSCRSAMERYVDEVNDYVRCLDRAQDSAVRESNDAVRRFNCKAKGSTFCY
jgi:hypothetical protein